MLDFAIRMVPLFALITAHPKLAINLTIVSRVQIHLKAVVALLVENEAFVAKIAEADPFLSRQNLDLRELGGLLVRHCRSLLFAQT